MATFRFPPRSQNFLELLASRVVVADGAMGTELYRRGIPQEANLEHLNLVDPQRVAEVHADYIAAGSRLIETNTFGANGARLARIGLEKRVKGINQAGVRIARQAAGTDCFVAGSVGPLPLPRLDEKDLSVDEKRAIFSEQMEAQAEAGVDLFLLETFAELDDLELALQVAAECGLPAVAQMTFLEGGRTRAGVAVEAVSRRLERCGAAVIGVNCGSGPREALALVERLAATTDAPLSAFPNAGFPDYLNGRYMYLATPEYFAARGRELVAAGAGLLGGCCGTGPEHIRALAAEVGALAPAPRRASPRVTVSETPPSSTARGERQSFLDARQQRPLVTVELHAPRGSDCRRVLDGARRLAEAGVDAISLAENPLARIRMGNIALATRIQQETGLEVIVHITGRDRNLLGLHSDLLGAHLLGIRNLLLVTGDPVGVSAEAGASDVFDLNSVGLLELASALNRSTTHFGAELNAGTDFLLGAAFNPNVSHLEGQLRKLRAKVDAGARFVQTQPVYDVAHTGEALALVEGLEVPVLLGILPLVSGRNAEFLHNEVPGIVLPEAVRRRMAGLSGEDGMREGLAIAAELVEAFAGRVAGFYLMPPFGRVEVALQLLTLIRRQAS